MYPVINVGSQAVHLFNVFVMIGLIAGVLHLEGRMARVFFEENKLLAIRIFIPVVLLLGFCGAILFDTWAMTGSFIPGRAIGLTFYGGLLLGLVLVIVFSKIFHFDAIKLLNLFTPPVVLGHAFGRIGCFFAGCCYGRTTNFLTGISFPEHSIPHAQFGSHPIHPTQLYESGFLFIFFGLTYTFKHKSVFPVYLLCYGLFRFLIEYLRADERGELAFFPWISPSQFISLMMVLIGGIIYLKNEKAQSFC
jgi:phosphatidylglycerol:prolipoprotein diacylglycerol transferase